MTEQELHYLITVNDRDLRDLKRRLDTVTRSMGTELSAAADKAGVSLKRTGDAAEQMGAKAAAAARLARAEVAKMGRAYTSAERAILTGAKRVAEVVGFGGGALAAAVAYVGVKFDDLKQKSLVAFTTLLHSGTQATKFLKQLQDYAVATPFRYQDLLNYSKQLLAMGYSARQVIPSLTAIGDATAALGGSSELLGRVILAMGQIKAKGTLQSQEMRQLAEAGIPAWQVLAKYLGVTIPKAMDLVQRRAVSSSTAVTALLSGMEKRYGGMMDRQSRTFSGMLSNLEDTVQIVSGTAMKPLFDYLQGALSRFVTNSGKVNAAGDRLAAMMQTKIVPAIDSTVKGIARAWPTIESLFVGAFHAGQQLWPILVTVAKDANAVADALGGWKSAFSLLIGGMIAVRAGMAAAAIAKLALTVRAAGLSAIFAGASFKAAFAGTIIGAAVLAAYLIVTHWKQVSAFFVKAWALLKGGAVAAWDGIKAAANTAAYLVLQAWTAGLRGVLKLASYLPFGIGDKAKAGLDRINGFLDQFKRNATNDLGAAGSAAGAAWANSFGSNVASALSWASAAADAVARGKRTAVAGAPHWNGSNSGTSTKKSGGLPSVPTYNPADYAGLIGNTAAIGGGGAGGSGGGSGGKGRRGVSTPFAYPLGSRGKLIGFPGQGTHSFTSGPNNWESDNAVDIAVSFGTPVVAVTAGVIGSQIGSLNSSDPKMAGLRLHLIGDNGVEYYYAHLSRLAVRAGQRVKKGQLVGWSGSANGVAHLHFAQSKGSPVGTIQGAGLSSGLTGIQGPKSSASSASAAKSLAAQLRQGRGNAGTMLQILAGIPQDTLVKVQDQWGRIVAKLAPKDIAKRVRDALSELNSGSAKEAKKGLKDLAAASDLVKQSFSTWQDAVGQAASDALDKLNQAVSDAQGALSTAFGRLADKAMSEFDAVTQDHLAKMRVRVSTAFGSFMYGQGDTTPAAAALAALQSSHDAAQHAKDVATAKKNLKTANDRLARFDASGISHDSNAYRAALKDQQDAQQAWDELQYEDKVAALQKQADAEQAAADAELQRQQRNYQSQRDLLREHLQDRLDLISKNLANGTETADQARKDLNAVWAEFGIDAATGGDLIGSAFSTSFAESLSSVWDTIAALQDAMRAVGIATGPTVKPPKIRKAPSLPSVRGGRIKAMATGAVVDRPTLALIGENPATTPEVVTPEKLLRRLMREEMSGLQTSGAGAGVLVTGNTFVVQSPADAELVGSALSRRLHARRR